MFKLKTGDPAFNPVEPVTINGFTYVPLAAARELIDRCEEEYSDTFLAGRDAARDALDRLMAPGPAERERRAAMEARERYAKRTCRIRQENDEYVCSAAGCGRRWAVDEDKPYCANDPEREED